MSGDAAAASGALSVTGGSLSVSGGTALGIDGVIFGGVSSDGSASPGVTPAAATVANWNVAGSGAWDTSSGTNWSGNVTPSASGDTANFGSIIGSTPATVTIDAGNIAVGTLTFNNPGGGSYTIAANSSYTLTLASGTTGVAATLTNSGGSQFITAPVVLGSNLAVSTTAGGMLTISGRISGSRSLTKAGAGTLTLAGSNTYSGGTTLSAGLLNIDHAHALSTGSLAIAGGSIGNASGSAITLSTTPAENWNGNFAFVGPSDLNLSTAAITLSGNPVVTVTQNNLTVGGIISGNDFLIKSGAGTLTLSGSNTYNYGTTLSAGQLNINNAHALGNGSFTIDGGTIANTTTGAIVLSTDTAESWNADFVFGGTNSLDLGYGNVNLYSNRTVTVNSGTLCVGGVIADSGHNYSLTQNGGGVLLLYGANTYGGGTTINGGTLQAGSSTATGLSTNSLTVNAAGHVRHRGQQSQRGGTFPAAAPSTTWPPPPPPR